MYYEYEVQRRIACNDEETLTFLASLAQFGDIYFGSPILGKCNLTVFSIKAGTPFQTGIFEPIPRICTMEYTPAPDSSKKLDSVLVPRPYPHLNSK